MTDLVNLTPHDITLLIPGGRRDVPRSGTVARVVTEAFDCAPIARVRSVRLTPTGVVEGLPDPVVGTVFIASAMAASVAKRADVVSPGHLVRDDEGRVIGCESLVRHDEPVATRG